MPLLKRKVKEKPQKPPKPPKETRLEFDLRSGRVVLTRTPVTVPVVTTSAAPPAPNPTPNLTLPPLPDHALPPPPYQHQIEQAEPAKSDITPVPEQEANDWLSLGYKMIPVMQTVGTGLVAVAGVVSALMEMEKERRKGAEKR